MNSQLRTRILPALAAAAALALATVGPASAAPGDQPAIPTAPYGSCTIIWTNVILGTEGDDILIGTSANDLIMGFGGDDILIGAGGRDVLLGGTGDDDLAGGAGNDCVFGGPGDDESYLYAYSHPNGLDQTDSATFRYEY